MYAARRSETGHARAENAMAPVRVSGGVKFGVVDEGGRQRITELCERDGYKLRLPRSAGAIEAALINTGGGLAGGDDVAHAFTLGARAEAIVSTPAAERVYRAYDETLARVALDIEVDADARFFWVPQETIIYEGARFDRQIMLDMEPSATVLLCEITVFGRVARGERISTGSIRDRWRVRRGGTLVFAEQVGMAGDLSNQLDHKAVGAGANTIATLFFAAPDAEDRLAAVRAVLDGADCAIAASAWNDFLVVRAIGGGCEGVRSALARVIATLAGRPVPRVWWT